MTPYEPPGINFFDVNSHQEMLLIAEPDPHAGWICYKHPDGQWVTLRKATEQDLQKLTDVINEAGVRTRKAQGAPIFL